MRKNNELWNSSFPCSDTVYYSIFQMVSELIPWIAQTQGETRLKLNDLRVQRPSVCSESFQWDTFALEGRCKKKLPRSSPSELWTHFFTFSPDPCKIEYKAIIKSSHWSQMRGKVSLATAQRHGVIKAWEPNTTVQLTHRAGRPVAGYPSRTRKVPLNICNGPLQDKLRDACQHPTITSWLSLTVVNGGLNTINHPKSKITLKGSFMLMDQQLHLRTISFHSEHGRASKFHLKSAQTSLLSPCLSQTVV